MPDGRFEHIVLCIQPSVHYLRLRWPVDTLISLFLTDSVPDQFELRPDDVWLEIRGVRGDLRMTRLSAGDFAFRAAVAGGTPLAEAARRGLAQDAAFDVGTALASLLAGRLVTGVQRCELEVER